VSRPAPPRHALGAVLLAVLLLLFGPGATAAPLEEAVARLVAWLGQAVQESRERVAVAYLYDGDNGIRLNALHPDAVFDTCLWTPEVLAVRVRHYGLSVDAYKRKNLLKTAVGRRDVAELAAELCGPLFAKTTAAQIPVDDGNDRVV
jgi:hypothetical protein